MTERPRELEGDLVLRRTRDADSPGWIDLLTRVFAEYEGCVLDVEAEEPELLSPATSFEAAWVLDRAGVVLGTVAARTQRGTRPFVELKKCYLDASLRGRGLGRVLVACVEDYTRAAGLSEVRLWSDARFELAHAVYARLGYARTGQSRELHDLSNTTEFEFVRSLARD